MEDQRSVYPEWEYRVVRHKLTEEEIKNAVEGETTEWYSVQEVYLGEDGVPYAHTTDLMIEGENVDDMRPIMKDMTKAFDLPVVEEMPDPPVEILEEEIQELKPLPVSSD